MTTPVKTPYALTTLENYAEAWKQACAAYEAIPLESDGTEVINIFLDKFEELRIMFGDPNKVAPLGVLNASSKG